MIPRRTGYGFLLVLMLAACRDGGSPTEPGPGLPDGDPAAVSVCFHADGDVPDWFAFQDGTGVWTRIAEDPPRRFEFGFTQGIGGVAWTVLDGGAFTALFFGSAEELAGRFAIDCEGAPPGKAVTGSVAGLDDQEFATVSLGNDFVQVEGGDGPFMLSQVWDGTHDLMAARNEFVLGPAGLPTPILQSLILRRGLNPSDGEQLPLLDFGTDEAFAPVERDLTVTNDHGDLVTLTMFYNSSIPGVAYFASAATSAYPGVPADRQETGDLHAISLLAAPGGDVTEAVRRAAFYFADAVDRTVPLGPPLSDPTVSVDANSPYARPRIELPVQSEYDQGWVVVFSDGVNRVLTTTYRGYGIQSVLDQTVPDLTGAEFAAAWGLSGSVSWVASATGGDNGGLPFLPPLFEGGLARSAQKGGPVNQ